MNDKSVKLLLKGLDCANCANKIEEKVNNLQEVKEANVNFSMGFIVIEKKEDIDKDELILKVKEIVNKLEPDVIVQEADKSKKSNHTKVKENIHEYNNESNDIKLLLKGLDCANCAGKIEKKVNELQDVEEANLNFSMGFIMIEKKPEADRGTLINEVKGIVNALEPDVIVEEFNKDKKLKVCHADGCACHGEHEHHEHYRKEIEEDSTDQRNRDKYFLALGIVIYVVAILTKSKFSLAPLLFIVSYILIGGKVVYNAARNILKGEVFDENFLMTVATVGAFAIGEYPEAVAVMLFYEVGEMFQGYAVNRSRKSISSLMDIRAEFATLLVDGKEKRIDPENVSINDIILIKPGERVPVDGIIIEGNTTLDTAALTGESVPRSAEKGNEILSGTINLSGVIKVQVTKEYGESTVSRILELVENAGNKKAKTEKFITKFARYYTPAVVFSAIAVAVIPPLVVEGAVFNEWLYRALVFLVVSCPCALVISIPLALFAGIGGASNKGVLIKGGNYLEALKDVDTVVFDKTGTLTKGVFKVVKIENIGIEKDELLKTAAIGESFSNHPIAKSIISSYNKEIDKTLAQNYEEISGNGVKVTIEGKEVLIGNIKLMNKFNVKCNIVKEVGTIVHIAIDNEYKGYIVISDEIKKDSKEGIELLKKSGVKNIVMLTGDTKEAAESVANTLGITKVYSELLPADKVQKVEELLSNEEDNKKVIFVGDGINDAPVLARADIGAAMGGIGSDAAIEAADIVLMRDEITALGEGIKVAKETNKILWQNIIFSLGIKVIVLILSTFGLAGMWEGVFADVGVTLIAVLNSMRALKK